MSTVAERVAEILVTARYPIVLTGAGMSAESGVPTFRDAMTGLWTRFDPHELATPEAFRRQPEVVFGWYVTRLRQVVAIDPHPGYQALVHLERLFGTLPIVTQNVDGLHRRAGSTDVTELHGSLLSFRCAAGHHAFPVEEVLVLAQVGGDGRLDPPVCASCGDLVRPNVVWFGEMLPEAAMTRAALLTEHCDVLLLVGTSSVVYPAAALPIRAQALGARVVEVNPAPTPFTRLANVAWQARAGDALPELAKQIVSMKAST